MDVDGRVRPGRRTRSPAPPGLRRGRGPSLRPTPRTGWRSSPARSAASPRFCGSSCTALTGSLSGATPSGASSLTARPPRSAPRSRGGPTRRSSPARPPAGSASRSTCRSPSRARAGSRGPSRPTWTRAAWSPASGRARAILWGLAAAIGRPPLPRPLRDRLARVADAPHPARRARPAGRGARAGQRRAPRPPGPAPGRPSASRRSARSPRPWPTGSAIPSPPSAPRPRSPSSTPSGPVRDQLLPDRRRHRPPAGPHARAPRPGPPGRGSRRSPRRSTPRSGRRWHSVQRRSAAQGVRLDVDVPADLAKVRLDPARFEEALLCLAGNALDAMPAGGTLRLAATAGRGRRRAEGGGHGARHVLRGARPRLRAVLHDEARRHRARPRARPEAPRGDRGPGSRSRAAARGTRATIALPRADA